MDFSSIDTLSLNALHNKTENLYKGLRDIRKAFKQDTIKEIESFMVGIFGKELKLQRLILFFQILM